MRLSGENEGKRESAIFCQQTFATKKREEKIPPQELGKYPLQKLDLDLTLELQIQDCPIVKNTQ